MFNAMIETLKANPRKIVFTEGHDARILEATARLVEGGFLTPILVGNVEEVKANAAKGGFKKTRYPKARVQMPARVSCTYHRCCHQDYKSHLE